MRDLDIGKPLLSIIIPVWNAEKYLTDCIESLIKQSYENLEFIFMNDGSKDGSLSILEYYAEKDSRVHIISQDNMGASIARLRGIERAGGGYVAFVDSDDFVERECYLCAMKAILEADADICVFNYEYNGKIQGIWSNDVVEKKDIFNIYLDGGIHNKFCNKVFRREVFKNVDFPMGRDIREDACIMPQILLNCERIRRLPEVFYHYRIVSTSLMHKKSYSDKELAGCHRNDFEKIRVLWDMLPERRKELSTQLIQLFERILFQHRDITYFNLDNILLQFINTNKKQMSLYCTDNISKFLLNAVSEYKSYDKIYRRYFCSCFKPTKEFSVYRVLRLMKYWVKSKVLK